MPGIAELKELECAETPLFLFDCTLKSGDVERWSTHQVTVDGQRYEARVLQHNAFEMRSSSDNATDGLSRISITLANADCYFSPIERNIGWKGARLTVAFLFYSLTDDAPASESRVVFRGIANAPDESTETGLKLTFTNRLNLKRIHLPETRLEKRCPWMFPSDAGQRHEALEGSVQGKFSSLYRCGYSADLEGGCGNLDGASAFRSCDHTRAQCTERGMFSSDAADRPTARFGGVEFVPPSIVVRGYGEKGSHVSATLDNQAKYSDYVPLIYGTGWYEPSIVFARNDGNLTRMEVLLGSGEIAGVLKVIVNDIDIPMGVAGANMTATGWYQVVSYGARNGAFNADFTNAAGSPLGDPYGSMAYMAVVVPNAINSGRSLPSIRVLIRGLKVARYDETGALTGPEDYSNNPVWVLLDILRRSGWTLSEIDAASFARAALVCDEPVQTTDLNGNSTLIPRYQCNLMLNRVRSASDVVRGIRNTSGLFLNFNGQGLLRVSVEGTLAQQQPVKPEGSNASELLNDGWPAYEFGDDSGLAVRGNGESSLRVYSRSSADSPNRFTVEFQDEFNEYQQDSYSIVDAADQADIGQEISSALPALGIPNYDQAMRTAYLYLCKSVRGNTYVDFETSVKSVNLAPGDIISLTYSREGFSRQPFRIVRIAPGSNYRRVLITAQWHDDTWYSHSGAECAGAARQAAAQTGVPHPLVGTVLTDEGTDFGIEESITVDTDGTNTVQLAISFTVPASPQACAASIPLVSLQPLYESTGGNLPGGVTRYYAISAVDTGGSESGLSFTIRATTPEGTDTNVVTLQRLSLAQAATGFNVYRGSTPATLLQIAQNQPVARQFSDDGLSAALVPPPDANFDHANFYWRFVLRPDEKADIYGLNAIGVSTAGMQLNEYRGAIARVSAGAGAGQERTILSNTESTLTVAPSWSIPPDSTSEFLIADASWQFGATATSSPATCVVPNRTGAIIQISGRSANVHDDECAYQLSPLTSWKIAGGSGSELDQDVPPVPTFGLYAAGQGAIEVVGIGFEDLANTRSITAGTLALAYWDEISGAPPVPLASAVSDTDAAINFGAALDPQPGDILQLDSELAIALETAEGEEAVLVARGAYGTQAASHGAGTPVYAMARKIFVMPFPRDFFGASGSGSYSFRVLFPDVRIAAADFFVTNSKGNSGVGQRAFTSTVDLGIRTLSGGQISIQVEGPLAIQSDVAPPFVVDAAHSVRDVFAHLGAAPTVSQVELQVTQNGVPYCSLSVPAGATVSDVVDGAILGPLQTGALLGVNVVAVPQTPDSLPGADLTVTIRL